MLTHTVFQKRYRLKYSETEEVDAPEEIKHPILRETILEHWTGNPLEIALVADVPAGTGMGSSGAYTVCLIKALCAGQALLDHAGRPGRGRVRDRDRHAQASRSASRTSTSRAHGGICAYTFHHGRHGRRRAARARRSHASASCATTSCSSTRASPRSASEILGRPGRARPRRRDAEMVENLHRTKEMGYQFTRAAADGRPRGLRRAHARALGEQAQALPGHDQRAHRHASTRSRAAPAALGGKLVGAGGGGFLLVYAQRPEDTRQAMAAAGAPELAVRLRVPGRHRHRVRVDAVRVGIVGCGLIGRKRAEALRDGDDARRRASTWSTSSRPALAPGLRRRRCALARRAARRWSPTSSSSPSPTTSWPGSRVRALEAGAHVLVEKPAGVSRRAGRRDRRRRGHRGQAASRSASTTASTPASRARSSRGPLRRATARSCTSAPATATAAGRATTASGAPTRRAAAAARSSTRACTCSTSPTGCWARCRCTARCCARSSGTPPSTTTRRSSSASAARARRRGRLLHVTWTEWKNMFSLEIYCRTAKLQVDGLVRSYGPQTLTHPPHEARARAARHRGRRVLPTRIRRGRRSGSTSRAAIDDGAPLLGDLADARYAWTIVRGGLRGRRLRRGARGRRMRRASWSPAGRRASARVVAAELRAQGWEVLTVARAATPTSSFDVGVGVAAAAPRSHGLGLRRRRDRDAGAARGRSSDFERRAARSTCSARGTRSAPACPTCAATAAAIVTFAGGGATVAVSRASTPTRRPRPRSSGSPRTSPPAACASTRRPRLHRHRRCRTTSSPPARSASARPTTTRSQGGRRTAAATTRSSRPT